MVGGSLRVLRLLRQLKITRRLLWDKTNPLDSFSDKAIMRNYRLDIGSIYELCEMLQADQLTDHTHFHLETAWSHKRNILPLAALQQTLETWYPANHPWNCIIAAWSYHFTHSVNITNCIHVTSTRIIQYFNYIMATIFSNGRSRSTRREPPTMGKQLVNFITCGFESSAPFL
jgi:hypothetical protein